MYRNFPIDTAPKLNVHKTFIRHPGRLRNVLRTFNLSPVSTGFNLKITFATFDLISENTFDEIE